MKKKRQTVIIEGPVSSGFIAESIAKHSTKMDIGAHSIFLGQVRNDIKEGNKVAAIEYTCYLEMAEEGFEKIREAAFSQFDLTCMHIYHSIGLIKAGEICLFVFVSASHRKSVFEALEWIVDEIKRNIPIWGKEITEDGMASWKENVFYKENK